MAGWRSCVRRIAGHDATPKPPSPTAANALPSRRSPRRASRSTSCCPGVHDAARRAGSGITSARPAGALRSGSGPTGRAKPGRPSTCAVWKASTSPPSRWCCSTGAASDPLLPRQGFPQQLLDHLRVRLPARRLHHLADEEAEHALLAALELRGLRRVLREHVGHRRLERAPIAHLREALGGDQLGGIAARAAEPRDQALRRVAIYGARPPPPPECRQLRCRRPRV